MTDATALPESIRGSRGVTAWLVATGRDGSGLYFHELTKGRNTGASFRATAKHYYRVDDRGRRQTWTRTVYSGARQTGHLKPQPPTEGRWSWLPKCDNCNATGLVWGGRERRERLGRTVDTQRPCPRCGGSGVLYMQHDDGSVVSKAEARAI